MVIAGVVTVATVMVAADLVAYQQRRRPQLPQLLLSSRTRRHCEIWVYMVYARERRPVWASM